MVARNGNREERPRLDVVWLGRVAYREGLARMERAAEERRAGSAPDRLLLLEHPPVITLGRAARADHLLEGRDALRARGIEVHEVARGGDVTYHGPGQLVGYPILDLDARGARDVHRYLRELEAGLGQALARLGLATRAVPGRTGLFAAAPGPRPRKLASIGVGVRRWITRHGFALNVDLDLSGFDAIVPCGLADVEMSSVARELGPAAPPRLARRVRAAVAAAFRELWA